MIDKVEKCYLCNKTFSSRSRQTLKSHKCNKQSSINLKEDMKKKQALKYFNHWALKKGYYKKAIDSVKFSKSMYYKHFLDLNELVVENNYPSAYIFLDYAIENNVSPEKWHNFSIEDREEFNRYLEIYSSPEQQYEKSSKKLRLWLISKKMNPDDFMDSLTPNKVLSIVKKGIVEPLVIVSYPEIAHRWADKNHARYSPHVFHSINEMININYWKSIQVSKSKHLPIMDMLYHDEDLYHFNE